MGSKYRVDWCIDRSTNLYDAISLRACSLILNLIKIHLCEEAWSKKDLVLDTLSSITRLYSGVRHLVSREAMRAFSIKS